MGLATGGGDPHSSTDGPSVVSFTLLQLNDVYEIAPVEGGRRGGLARVATLRRRLLEENPRLVTVLPGDFLSPSAMGATTVDGVPVAGEQMIDALNAVGIDYVTLGNHEFDVGEPALLARIAESRFTWVSSNVTNAQGQRYPGVVENATRVLTDADGDRVTVGFFGVTLEMVKEPFIQYEKPVVVAAAQAEKLSASSDVVVALTHLNASEDEAVAAAVPRLDVLLGGHEHEAATLLADRGARRLRVLGPEPGDEPDPPGRAGIPRQRARSRGGHLPGRDDPPR